MSTWKEAIHKAGKRIALKEDEKALMQLATSLNLFKIKQYSMETRVSAMLSQLLSNWKVNYFVDLVTSLKDSVQIQEMGPGQPIIVEGSEVTNRFYMIEYGNVKASSGLTFTAGEWFGEEALLEESVYENDFHSSSAVRLLVINSEKERCYTLDYFV